jgi:hypothetical protein
MASDVMGVAFSNRRTPAKLSRGKSAKVVGATNSRQNNKVRAVAFGCDFCLTIADAAAVALRSH